MDRRISLNMVKENRHGQMEPTSMESGVMDKHLDLDTSNMPIKIYMLVSL